MSAKPLDRRFVTGLLVLFVIGGLIYFSGRSEHRVSIGIKPMTVHLNLSDEVKHHIADTHAALSVKAIVSDKEVNSSPLQADILDHREQIATAGQDTVQFEPKTLELDLGKQGISVDPVVTFHVVTQLDRPAGNCIRCEEPVFKASDLKEGDNRIEIKCDGWLSMGVCVEHVK
jgi:hypothetical protein